jgi:hypothetical protein
MMIEKYKLLTDIPPTDNLRHSVKTLKKQYGFSLLLMEYHWGNTSRPYLMHDCRPLDSQVEKTWYESADRTDITWCIYCKEPYPTEILTAAKLLNAYMTTQTER